MLFFGTTLLSACSESDTDDDIPAPVPPAPVVKESVDIDAGQDIECSGEAESSTLKLVVTSSSDWSLTISDTRAGIDWISASATEGKAGETTVTFNIGENTLRTTRTAYIKLKNAIGNTTVVYTQNHYEPANLTLSVSELAVGQEAVRKTFTLKSDIAWTFTSEDESFCNISPVRGNAGEYTITAAITENTSETKRSTVLIAKAGYETATVLIEQERKKPELNIDKGIRTLDDLCRFRDAVNEGGNLAEWKYNGEINLLEDIDLSYVENWTPIGSEKVPFTGIFNGNGFTLRNLRIQTQSEFAGLFGYATDATIKNLHLEHVDVESTYIGNSTTHWAKAAGICGCLKQKNMTAKIDNCTVSGYTKAPKGSSGICGSIYDSTVSNCTNYAIATYGIGQRTGQGEARLISCTDCGFTTWPGWSENDTDCVDEAYSLPETLYTQLFGDKRLYSKDEIAAELETEKSFRCAKIAMRNMRILELLPNITTLTCTGCSLSDLDLSHNPILKTVYCNDNDLVSLETSPLMELHTLDCSKNQIRELNISANTELTKITCSDNRINVLDLTENQAVQSVICNMNELTSILVPNCHALSELRIDNNSLSLLDVSNCRALTDLYCNGNAIESLIIPDNCSIKFLEMKDNRISELDCMKMKNLRSLRIGNNLLESIDISECPNLSILDATNSPKLETIWVSESMMNAIPSGFSKDAKTSYRIKGGTLTYNPDNNAYEIYSIYDLIEYSQIKNRKSDNVTIMNDLDFSDSSTSLGISNGGIFEGNNRKITNLSSWLFSSNTGTIRNITLENNKGVFCYSNEGMISNVELLNSSSNLCSTNGETGIIEHCQVTASIEETDGKNRGGVCNNNYGTLKQCHANINLVSTLMKRQSYACGGLCGYNEGIIFQCSSKGELSHHNSHIDGLLGIYGGLVGEHHKGKISECFSSCEVRGETNNHSGGLVGYVTMGHNGYVGEQNQNTPIVCGCYATGTVTGGGTISIYTGALIGSNYGYVYGCYATSGISDFVYSNVKGAKLEYCACPERQIYGGEGSVKGSVSKCKDVRSVVADGYSAVDANAASWWSSSYISTDLYENAVTYKCPKLAWELDR